MSADRWNSKIKQELEVGKGIIIKYVFGRMKAFKIPAERYRNRQQKVIISIDLIRAIYNFKL